MAHNKDLIENPNGGLPRLLEIMRALRDPQHGCPWDIEQTPQTITPHIIEEAYELVDAINSDKSSAIKDELSDALLHVIMISEMMSEKQENNSTFNDVVKHCCN